MTILQELDTKEAQYDAHVKRILSNRYVLAWILKHATEEFREVPIKQIAEECIADDISVSKVKVMPGQTNVEKEENADVEGGKNITGEAATKRTLDESRRPERILGTNTEDKGKILSEEYGIEIKDDFGEEVNCMCNLGEGIREEALEEGIEQGKIELVCKKLRKEKAPAVIADELEEDLEKIQSICPVAAPFAPDYACEEVYTAWQRKSNH